MFVLYLLILLLEIIYYSLFMKYSKGGNFIRYIILFTLITIMLIFVGTNQFISYLILTITMFIGLKYIVKIKTGLFDMLILTIMILIKLFIEIIVISALFVFIKNAYILSFIASIIKVLLILVSKEKLTYNYNSLKKVWYNNNFGVRYLFTLALFLYTIISFLFLIF